MARLRPGEKRAQISFQRPEDLRLFAFLKKKAYEARYDIGTFMLVSLHEAFKGQIEEEEVSALAEEAAAKVRMRIMPVVENNGVPELSPPTPVEAPPAKPKPVSMEQAAKQAEAEIARLDAVAQAAVKKKTGVRKGVPSPPPMPR